MEFLTKGAPTGKSRLLSAAVLAVLALAACGGGDAEDRTGGTGPEAVGDPARAGYVAAADRICSRRQPLRGEEIEDPSQAGEAARAQLSFRSALDGELRRLSPPAELRRDVGAFHARSGEVIALLRREILLAEASGGLPEGRVHEFNRLAAGVSRALAERSEIARRIGFRVCGAPERGPPLSSPAGG